MKDPIRLGMVGGGEGAFIGQVHRMAARLDGRYHLVAGALSSRADVSRQSAEALGIAADRAYTDFGQMAVAEAARVDGIEAAAGRRTPIDGTGIAIVAGVSKLLGVSA